jgi:hypothetical protein
MAPVDDELCPPMEEIEAFVARGSARAGLIAHVGSCTACRGMVERLRETAGSSVGSFAAVVGGAADAIPGYPIVGEIHRVRRCRSRRSGGWR